MLVLWLRLNENSHSSKNGTSGLVSAPNETRTRVPALKELYPRPLDDGGIKLTTNIITENREKVKRQTTTAKRVLRCKLDAALV